MPDPRFHRLPPIDQHIQRPERFTYPFNYVPHPLALRAAEALQEHLKTQQDWSHNFDDPNQAVAPLGKMFGVLVVENEAGELGYLAAFSGKIAESNHLPGFVPPVYDLLDPQGFFKQEEAQLNALTAKIASLERDPAFAKARHNHKQALEDQTKTMADLKEIHKYQKKQRQQERAIVSTLPQPLQADKLREIDERSKRDHFELKDFKRIWKEKVTIAEQELAAFTTQIDALKAERRAGSSDLQRRIFDEYQFLNAYAETRGLIDIFKETPLKTPPAGAGECAAPKLLQYAFQQRYQPIALAEFWWGAPPKSEVRVTGNYYPACRGKCHPILSHMLEGLEVDPNPFEADDYSDVTVNILYQDTYLLVVEKPAGLLSVPGNLPIPSVESKLKAQFPDKENLLLVHRLDMATSGLLVVALDLATHKHLQRQFVKRHVTKRYVAVLETTLAEQSGLIDLPLRNDYLDRPRQIVCFEEGRLARTKWEVAAINANQTRIHFYPITGRTHQLRVHAAHADGLNCPIKGDALYGTRADRLYLHAEFLSFQHPITKELMEMKSEAPF